MQTARKYVLTIAGLDPCSGAGLTADIKTFEQHKVYGLSVCTAITLQTEDTFYKTRWEKPGEVIEAIAVLLDKYPVSCIKTGIVPSLDYLAELVSFLNSRYPAVKIVIDPILRASTGFNFIKDPNKDLFYSVLKKCYLITPNLNEVVLITGNKNEMDAAREISQHCSVFLKGGHSHDKPGIDYLVTKSGVVEFKPASINGSAKHGSGCILSSSITAHLALGHSLEDACQLSKHYIESTLLSNPSLLAYHHVS